MTAAMEVQGQPEPNGWELLRGLNGVKESIDKMASGMVPMSLFLEATKRISALETENADQRKTRTQQWFAIAMCALGGIVSVIGGVIMLNLKGA